MGGRGRGRGRGANVSFNVEQLGFSRGEALPGPVTQPPPLFPSLENKPLPLDKDVEQEYLLVVRKDLNMRMRNSPFFLTASTTKSTGMQQQFTHRFQAASKQNKELPVIWERTPAELTGKVAVKRKIKSASGFKPKIMKQTNNTSDILKKYEEKEKNDSDAEDENKAEGKAKDDKDEDEEEKDEVVDDEEEVDEELDEGTDYANAYFDNGENYGDEDDNLDDEPVY